MSRFILRLAVVSAPLVVFIWWVTGPVQAELGNGFRGIIYMLAGVAALALVEGLLFKYWLLPLMAQAVSDRLCAGNYLPGDDPLVRLVSEISEHRRRELLPELERLVEADPARERGWLELARVLESEFSDPRQAVSALLRGAERVRRREDAAMLMWRAVTLSERHPECADQAPTITRELLSRYPDTGYGRVAARRSR